MSLMSLSSLSSLKKIYFYKPINPYYYDDNNHYYVYYGEVQCLNTWLSR